MGRLIAVLLTVALLLAAAGMILTSIFHGPPPDRLVEIVPREASLYASVYLDPSTAQGRSFRSFIGRVDADDASGLLDQLLEPCASTFEEVEESSATQVAVFVLPSGAGACVTDGDPIDKPGDSLSVRDRWVMGAPEAVQAAASTPADRSLGSTDGYLKHAERVPFDRIALFYRRGETPETEGEISLAARFHRYVLPAGVTVLASRDGRLVLEGSTDAGRELWTDEDSVELSKAPADSWLAAALPPADAWVSGVARLFSDLGVDTSSIAEPLNRALTVFPRDPGDVTIAWATGPPADPAFGVRTQDRTLTLFGDAPDSDGLASRPQAREALNWLDGHPPIALYDGDSGSAWLSLATTFAGIDVTLDRVDRAVLGVRQSDDTLGWQLVVSASEPKG